MMESEHARIGEAGTPIPRMLAGLALLAPAALCCLLTLALPTLRTITLSFQKANPLAREAQYVGAANYTNLFQDRVFSSALGFTLAIVVTRLLAVAIVPPLLALAAGPCGPRVRIPVRLLFTLPLALFAPVSILLAWLMALNPQFGLLGGQGGGPPLLADPARARATLLLIDGLITFGLACGLGLVFYLAGVRGSREGAGQRTWRPLAITWVIGLFATAALALQSFTLSFALTGGGPANSTVSLGLFYYMQAFQRLSFGPGAAVATVILAVAGLLGLLAGLLAVSGGLRLELVSRQRPADEVEQAGGAQPGAAVLLGILLLGSVGACALGVLPVPWSALNSLRNQAEMLSSNRPLFPAAPSLRAYQQLTELLFPQAPLNTIVPALIATMIQIALAYAGALGIGALRPLGRRSEWLLLPFSPWLFVTIGPLSVVAFESLRTTGRLNTLVGLVSPILVSIPALFILTLFFKGQAARLRVLQAEGQPSGFFRMVILPSLPLAVLLGCALLLVQMQALLWPLLVANDPQLYTEPLVLISLVRQSSAAGPLLAAALTAYGLPIFVFFFLAFSLFQVFYLDRLALSAKRET